MASASNFTGKAQDFIDWFKVGHTEKNKIVLPETLTGGLGLAPDEENEEERRLPPLQSFSRNSGINYTKKYVDEHYRQYQTHFNTAVEAEPFSLNNVDNVTTDDGTESEFGRTLPDDPVGVYFRNDFTKYDERSRQLPIYNSKKEILRKIASYHVVVIVGDTGCGKSTQVPQFILDEAQQDVKYCNIVVTQPRKLAAVSLASRISEERQWNLGNIVGYQVGLDNNTCPDTRISYVTTEVLVQKIIHSRSLCNYTHIILDEVHERDEHTDFALLVIKKLLYTVSRSTKVILMSATIDASKFARYFEIPVLNRLVPAPILTVREPRLYSVHIYYLDELSSLCEEKKLPKVDRFEPSISFEMHFLVSKLLKRFDEIERKEENIQSNKDFPLNRGAVLIFLPGLPEIEILIEILQKDCHIKRWDLYPLHSSITVEEQNNVFKMPEDGFRKVILSTNIAESSITVSDVKYVIDYGLTKLIQQDPTTHYTSLNLAWTSKASCDQRAGRAGRVSSGRVYRLMPRMFYEDMLDFTIPEICRMPLSQVVLKVKVLDMGPPKALLALALDAPNLNDIHTTILSLKQIGALAVKAEGVASQLDGDLTFIGRVAARLPVDPCLSKLIILGFYFGCLEDMVVIAAGLTLKSFHAQPFHNELEAFLSKVCWAHRSASDCLSILNAYNYWKRHYIGQQGSKQNEKGWAKKSYVELTRLYQVRDLVNDLSHRLERLKITPRNRQNPPMDNQGHIRKFCMAAAFFPHYFKRIYNEDYEKDILRELGGQDPNTTVMISGLPQGSAILYDGQIREMFTEVADDMRILYEGSKAYIIFPRWKDNMEEKDSAHLGKLSDDCPNAMYLSIKMRHIRRLRDSLTLKIFSPEETKRRLSEMEMSSNSEHSAKTYVTPRVLEISGPVNGRAKGLRPPAMPSSSVSSWRINITYVENASKLWVFPSDSATAESYSYVQRAIHIWVNSSNCQKIAPDDLAPGLVCIAPFEDKIHPTSDNPTHFRAEVIKVSRKLPQSEALVHFVDYGNNAFVPVSKLCTLPQNLYDIPKFAIESYLCKVKPAVASGSENKWSNGANEFVKQYEYCELSAEIYSVVNGTVRLELMISRDNSLNNLLIERKYAISMEESLLSKQNHNTRLHSAEHSEDITHVTFQDTSSLRYSDIYCGKSNIRGPSSPIELKFGALSRTGSSKSVKIQSASVNSAALDLETQSKHDRMLIASSVALNQKKSALLLRNTTIMPSFPGVLSLCFLTFCPVAELRFCDKTRKYTGALIGLGCQDSNDRAIYPSEDVEVQFDFDFTDDDLDALNNVRFSLCKLLEQGEDVADKELVKRQNDLREDIMKLFSGEKRSYCEPVYCHYPYKWNKIPTDRLHVSLLTRLLDKTSQVYPLHNGVFKRPILEMEKAQKDQNNLLRFVYSLGVGEYAIESQCYICRVKVTSNTFLMDHLSSEEHMREERRLQKDLEDIGNLKKLQVV